MRILQVLEPGVDGVFRHVEGLVEYLLGRGHEVALAYSSRRGSEALERLVARVRARGFPVVDLRVSNAPAPGDLPAMLRLGRLMTTWRPEVVHAHSSKAGALARPWCALLGRPGFYTPHAYFGMGRRGGKAAVFSGIERVLGRVGWTVHVSSDEAEFARRVLHLPERRRVVVTNGIDTARFRPAADPAEKESLRARLGLPAQVRLIGTLGRLSFQKDPETTYRALAGVLKRGEVEFAHVGSGELSDSCAALAKELGIADAVHRIPYLDAPADFYRTLDVFVLTSRYEGLSLAVLEALATNLPVVLSTADGNAVWQTEGLSHAGFAAPGDADAVRKAVMVQLGREGVPNHREVVLEGYSASAAFGRLEALYREGVNRG